MLDVDLLALARRRSSSDGVSVVSHTRAVGKHDPDSGHLPIGRADLMVESSLVLVILAAVGRRRKTAAWAWNSRTRTRRACAFRPGRRPTPRPLRRRLHQRARLSGRSKRGARRRSVILRQASSAPTSGEVGRRLAFLDGDRRRVPPSRATLNDRQWQNSGHDAFHVRKWRAARKVPGAGAKAICARISNMAAMIHISEAHSRIACGPLLPIGGGSFVAGFRLCRIRLNCAAGRSSKGIKMSKKLIRGSLLATTVIAGMSFTTAAFAQDVTRRRPMSRALSLPLPPMTRPRRRASSRPKPPLRPKRPARPTSSSPAP